MKSSHIHFSTVQLIQILYFVRLAEAKVLIMSPLQLQEWARAKNSLLADEACRMKNVLFRALGTDDRSMTGKVKEGTARRSSHSFTASRSIAAYTNRQQEGGLDCCSIRPQYSTAPCPLTASSKRMASTLKLSSTKRHIFKETGSPFDATPVEKIMVLPAWSLSCNTHIMASALTYFFHFP